MPVGYRHPAIFQTTKLEKDKTMKKNYIEPEMALIKIATSGFLAASMGDVDTGGINNDGEVTPGTPDVDPSDPGWGSDY